MKRLSVDEFLAEASAFDEVVASADYLDKFCSSSDWVVPAHDALMPAREPWVFRWDAGYVAMATAIHRRGFRYVEPLEASWGLACPVVAADANEASERFVHLCRERADDWDVMVVCGILDDAQIQEPLFAALAKDYDVHPGSTTARHVASLAGGVDGFLARRSRNFRRGLRRSRRAAAAAAIEVEVGIGDPASLYARIQRVEERTWKGIEQVGINVGGMKAFYAAMVERLAARGALRVMFARDGDRDVAYILGGVFGGLYRGLQFGYDAELRNLGLGGICQYHQIVALCDEGVEDYDLGTTGGDYKRRWAESTRTSTTAIVVRR